METIVAAALQFDGLVLSLPRPARHGHVLWVADMVVKDNLLPTMTQGFTTSTGRFVCRIEARNIA